MDFDIKGAKRYVAIRLLVRHGYHHKTACAMRNAELVAAIRENVLSGLIARPEVKGLERPVSNKPRLRFDDGYWILVSAGGRQGRPIDTRPRQTKYPRRLEVTVTFNKILAALPELRTMLGDACGAFMADAIARDKDGGYARGNARSAHVVDLWRRGALGYDDSLILGIIKLVVGRNAFLQEKLLEALTDVDGDKRGNRDRQAVRNALEI